MTTFSDLKLHEAILKAVTDAGYTQPTPIQEQAIPLAMAGKDLLASAQTGTGKTAAFVLPILNRLVTPSAVKNSRGPRALILTPTRELATQVKDAAMKYGNNLRQFNIVSILGGMPYQRQRQQLSRFVDIIVATPGRLLDYMGQGQIDFSRLEVLVLDEADRMLDMGFREPVAKIAKATPPNRQTLLFSATMDASINALAGSLLKDPTRIKVEASKVRHENIEQVVHFIEDLTAKKKLLTHLLKQDGITQVIVFTATKRSADKLADDLDREGIASAPLHGDMRQSARNRTIAAMHSGDVKILVATDVAARGIDVAGLSHIINFDLPRASEDYVHRIGRTGRAGAKGIAISLAYGKERGQVRKIERDLGYVINNVVVPGFETRFDIRSEGRGSRPSFRNDRGNDRRGERGGFRGDRSAPRERGERNYPETRGVSAPREGGSWQGRDENRAPRGERRDSFSSRGPARSGAPVRSDRPERRESFNRGFDRPRSEGRGFEGRDSRPQGSSFQGNRSGPPSRDSRPSGRFQGNSERRDSRPAGSRGFQGGKRPFRKGGSSRGGPRSDAPRGE